MLTTNQKRIQAERNCLRLIDELAETRALLLNAAMVADYLCGLARKVDEGTHSNQTAEWKEMFVQCEKSYQVGCSAVGSATHKARVANTTRPIEGTT